MSNADEQPTTNTSIPEQEVVQRPKRRPKRSSRKSEKTGGIQMPKLKLSRPVEQVDKESLRDLRNAQPQVNGLIRRQGLTVPLPTRRKDLKVILLRAPSYNQPHPSAPVLKPMILGDEADIPEIRDLVDGGDPGIEFRRLTLKDNHESMTEDDQIAELGSMSEIIDTE